MPLLPPGQVEIGMQPRVPLEVGEKEPDGLMREEEGLLLRQPEPGSKEIKDHMSFCLVFWEEVAHWPHSPATESKAGWSRRHRARRSTGVRSLGAILDYRSWLASLVSMNPWPPLLQRTT